MSSNLVRYFYQLLLNRSSTLTLNDSIHLKYREMFYEINLVSPPYFSLIAKLFPVINNFKLAL